MEIYRELQQIDDTIELQFVSYATGAATFKAEGHNVIDLDLPEENSFADTIILAYRTIRKLRPKVVISHEEFAALVAARIANVPSIFICTWLPPAGSVAAESLAYADQLIMIERPGLFPALPDPSPRPTYVGPIFRKMKYSLADRSRLRHDLGIDQEALAILVVPGGAWPEKLAPIYEPVLTAFLALERPSKRLFWLAGQDLQLLQQRTAGIAGVEVIEYCSPVERLIVPCDLVITKGTHGITLDAASLGVPSISLSPGLNPIDEILIPRIHNNVALMASAVDGATLLEYIERVTSIPSAQRFVWQGIHERRGAEVAAERIVETLQALTVQPGKRQKSQRKLTMQEM